MKFKDRRKGLALEENVKKLRKISVLRPSSINFTNIFWVVFASVNSNWSSGTECVIKMDILCNGYRCVVEIKWNHLSKTVCAGTFALCVKGLYCKFVESFTLTILYKSWSLFYIFGETNLPICIDTAVLTLWIQIDLIMIDN